MSDVLSRIMEFSCVKERRNLSCVSTSFRDTFDISRKECTRLFLDSFVETLLYKRRTSKSFYNWVVCSKKICKESSIERFGRFLEIAMNSLE